MSSHEKLSKKHENFHKISEIQYLDLKIGTGKDIGTINSILTSDSENFQTGVSYNAMSSHEKSSKKHENFHKISEIQYLDLKIGTGKYFGTIKPILTSDSEDLQTDVSYNAMSSHEKLKFNILT